MNSTFLNAVLAACLVGIAFILYTLVNPKVVAIDYYICPLCGQKVTSTRSDSK